MLPSEDAISIRNRHCLVMCNAYYITGKLLCFKHISLITINVY
jgi:hypothetical protein